MKNNQFKWLSLCLVVFVLTMNACSGTSSLDGDIFEDIDLYLDGDAASSISVDADGDGVYTSCDVDDNDATITDIKEVCDDPDFDGFVNTACDEVADLDGDGTVTDEERAVLGVNCDVCPLDYDPDQLDSNNDGVGDACTSESGDPYDDEDPYDDNQDPYDPNGQRDPNQNPNPTANLIDSDADGLNDSVDPEPTQFNEWGLINNNDYDVAMSLADHFQPHLYLRTNPAMELPGIDVSGDGHTLPTVVSGGFASKNAALLPISGKSGFIGTNTIVHYGVYIVSANPATNSAAVLP